MSETGKIVQVIGAVVDIEFPLGELPEILRKALESQISNNSDSAEECKEH